MTLEVKNLDKDADVRTFEHGRAEVAKAGSVTVGGRRWSPAGAGRTTSSRSREPIPARSITRAT